MRIAGKRTMSKTHRWHALITAAQLFEKIEAID